MTVCQQWVTAINAAKARFLLSLSSYQKRVTDSNRLSINDVVAFAEQFKKQVFSKIICFVDFQY